VRANDRRDPLPRSVALGAAALFLATLAWRFLTFTGFSNDHYAHLALAQQVLLGERPVRDFSDPGWPLTYLISAAAWRLAGDAMATEWTVMALALAVGAACTVIAAHRLSGSLPIAVVVTTLEILIFPRTYSYPKIVAYAVGAVLILAAAARPSWPRIAQLAAVVASAFLLRHDHGLYIGVASATAVALASVRDSVRLAARRVVTLTTLTGLFLLPWVLFIVLNGGLRSYFDRALEYAGAEAAASNLKLWPAFSRLPGQPLFGLAPPSRPLAQVEWTPATTEAVRQTLERRYGLELVRVAAESHFYYVHDTTEANLSALDDDPHVAGTTGLGRVRRPAWREFLAAISPLRISPALHSAANADAWLFWLFWTLPLLCGVLALTRALRGQERWPGELAAVGAFTVLAIFVNAGFLRDMVRTRVSDAIVPPVLLGAWGLGLCWTTPWRRRVLQGIACAVTAGVVVISFATISRVAELPERVDYTGIRDGIDGLRAHISKVATLLVGPHRQEIAPPSYVSSALMPFFAYLDRCTTPADRLIVTGEFPDVLVLAGRPFASDGVVMGAWYSSAIHQDLTLERLRQRPALFVIYVDAAPFRARFPLIDNYFAEAYEPLVSIAADGESIPILVQRSRVPVGTDRQTGWRCFK
jgi:hypothetical protein